jgi:hypothetical protein
MGAKVGGNLEMNSSSFAGAVAAEYLSVERLLAMEAATFRGNVTLNNAKIGGDLSMRGTTFGDSQHVNLHDAKIGGIFNLSGAKAAHIDLFGAVVEELRLGLSWWWVGCKAPTGVAAQASDPGAKAEAIQWRLGDPARFTQCDRKNPHQSPGQQGRPDDLPNWPTLILRNAHVGAFQDEAETWPPSVDLEGFHYDRLGGLDGGGHYDMRTRLPEEWIDWLGRNGTFSTQPYTALSSVLIAAGHRDTAEAVQLAARERERDEMWKQGKLGSWAWLSFLSWVAGYGIGIYTFFALWWVFGLTLLGALVLRYSPNARARGWPWRVGASLHRLLPIVELSKDFEDFFDNSPSAQFSEPRNLNRFQVFYFAGHALAGWVLGFFLLAAMGGLTQKG